jgi:hypothetical protein
MLPATIHFFMVNLFLFMILLTRLIRLNLLSVAGNQNKV